MRIERSVISTPEDYGEVQGDLGLSREATSLPEWQGWDRTENAGFIEPAGIMGLDLKSDVGGALDQLRNDPEYANLPDLDEKRFLLDVMNNVSGKLDGLADEGGSEKLLNFRETFNEMLDLYQTAYSRQLVNIKG